MHPIISTALNAICLERNDRKHLASFDAAKAIVDQFGEKGLAELLFSEIPRSVPFEVVAELFNLLAWQTNDNGADMTRSIEAWLIEGVDTRKLQIALNLDVYPFIDAKEMERVLSLLAEAHPLLSARCRYLIESRAKQNESR